MFGGDDLEGPFGSRWKYRERRVFDAIKAMIPTATDDQAVEFIDAMQAMMDKEIDDLKDRMDSRGHYDPDY